tara:strand:- start:444 stop:692 length:249 start_codon:yes stop_codon:yes gene_type:complete
MSLSDTFTLFLSNAINRELPIKERAAKIRKCAKLINGSTKEKSLKLACRALRNQKIDSLVISAMEEAEASFWLQRENNNHDK